MASEKELLQDLKLSATSKLLGNQPKICRHKASTVTQPKECNEYDIDSSASESDVRHILETTEEYHMCDCDNKKLQKVYFKCIIFLLLIK